MEEKICPRCRKPMLCLGNLSGFKRMLDPTKEDITWICETCKGMTSDLLTESHVKRVTRDLSGYQEIKRDEFLKVSLSIPYEEEEMSDAPIRCEKCGKSFRRSEGNMGVYCSSCACEVDFPASPNLKRIPYVCFLCEKKDVEGAWLSLGIPDENAPVSLDKDPPVKHIRDICSVCVRRITKGMSAN